MIYPKKRVQTLTKVNLSEIEKIDSKIVGPYMDKIASNRGSIEQTLANASEMTTIRGFFANKKVFILDCADGNAFLDDYGNPINKAAEMALKDLRAKEIAEKDTKRPRAESTREEESVGIRRTAKFKFFKNVDGVCVITPVYNVLASVKETLQLTYADMKTILDNPRDYGIPVVLDEHTMVYAMKNSLAKNSLPSKEFEVLCEEPKETEAKK